MYRAHGPELLQSVGEVEFANGVAAMSASGTYGAARVCAGIVGYADLSAPGVSVDLQLEALTAAGNGRLKGIRGHAPWDPLGVTLGKTWAAGAKMVDMRYGAPEGWLRNTDFRAGYSRLADYHLSYDSWAFQHQLGDIADLAANYESTPIIVNHAGGPVLVGPYEGKRDEALANWRRGIESLGPYENVYVKLGGLGIGTPNLRLRDRAAPPSSSQLAELLRPFVETCIGAVGAERCMFESDFPPDKVSYSYGVLWNAFKIVTAGFSSAERHALFSGTAARVYRLDT
jgi:predicted TIM-barrel fold metal-dependent hydrolase